MIIEYLNVVFKYTATDANIRNDNIRIICSSNMINKHELNNNHY